MLSEHAWDMLLHIFCAMADNAALSEAKLFGLVELEEGLGKRWLEYLVTEGQVHSEPSGGDVVLTSSAVVRMRSFLDQTDAQWRLNPTGSSSV